MPIAPRPYTARCLDCGWKKTYAPRSDVLRAGDIPPYHCPLCKSTHIHCEVESYQPNSILLMLKRFFGVGEK